MASKIIPSIFFTAVIGILISCSAFAANVTMSEAEEAIKLSENTVNYLSGLGFDTARFSDLLQDEKYSFKLRDYGRVVETSNKAAELKALAISLKEKTSDALFLLHNAERMGFDTGSASELLNQSGEEFNSNNFEIASDLAEKASIILNELFENSLKENLVTLENLRNRILFENLEIIVSDKLYKEAKEELELGKFSDAFQIKAQANLLNSSVNHVIDAKYAIDDMKLRNLATARANDLFNEALMAIELRNFDKAAENSQQIIKLKDKSYQLEYKINEVNEVIKNLESQGIDAVASRQYLKNAGEKYASNNYEEAEKLLDAAMKEAENSRSASLIFGLVQKSSLKFKLEEFIKLYWWILLLAFFSVFAISIAARKVFSHRLLERKIRNLGKEQDALIELMKNLQNDYFRKKTVSRHSYEMVLDKYQARMLKISEKIPVLESKLMKKHGQHNLHSELAKLMEQCHQHIDRGHYPSVKHHYEAIRGVYSKMNPHNKRKVHGHIMNLKKKIITRFHG